MYHISVFNFKEGSDCYSAFEHIGLAVDQLRKLNINRHSCFLLISFLPVSEEKCYRNPGENLLFIVLPTLAFPFNLKMMPKSIGARAKSPPPGRAKKTTPQRATSPNASTRRVKGTAPSNGTPRRPSASLETKSHPCAKKTPAKPTHHKAPKTTPDKRPEGPEKRGSQAAATDSPSPSGSVKKGGVRCKKIPSGNKVLLGVLESLKISKQARSEATDKVNDVVDCILKHVKTSSKCFQDIAKLPTGSYYENVKVS